MRQRLLQLAPMLGKVYLALRAAGPETHMKRLAEDTKIAVPTLNRSLRQLECVGLVARERFSITVRSRRRATSRG